VLCEQKNVIGRKHAEKNRRQNRKKREEDIQRD
jgi:hypothetical protein